MNIQPDIILQLVVFALAISVHESSHAYVAFIKGDSTAKRNGRITLNPVAHVDPVGTILVPVLLAMSGGVVFGWAKPVKVNPNRLRNPRRDEAFVSAAGPGANLALALISIIICTILAPVLNDASMPLGEPLGQLLVMNTIINVILAVFNMIPVPPLDGGGVLQYFMSYKASRWLKQNQMILGMGLLLLLMMGVLNRILSPFINLAFQLQMSLISVVWDAETAIRLLSGGTI